MGTYFSTITGHPESSRKGLGFSLANKGCFKEPEGAKGGGIPQGASEKQEQQAQDRHEDLHLPKCTWKLRAQRDFLWAVQEGTAHGH